MSYKDVTFHPNLTILGGQESLCKHNKENDGQTGNCDQNAKQRKECTCEGSRIQEKKDWKDPRSENPSAWKEIGFT